jgi:hypothetical protein
MTAKGSGCSLVAAVDMPFPEGVILVLSLLAGCGYCLVDGGMYDENRCIIIKQLPNATATTTSTTTTGRLLLLLRLPLPLLL